MTLTEGGRGRLLEDPNAVMTAQDAVRVPGVEGLGMYAVLGGYDFVAIVEAPDNDAAARYSIRLGVKAGAHIATLPAVPIALLNDPEDPRDSSLLEGVELGIPDER